MKKFFIITILLFTALVANVKADTVLSGFEVGITTPTYFVDEWEDSPFNNALCTNTTVEVIDNPYKNELDTTAKVLHYVRPYYSGDRNGVEIRLEQSFEITSTYQYIHVMVYKPVSSRLVLSAIDNVNEVKQCTALCSTDSRANAWSDAVFAVRASGSTIDRIRIYPDCETAVGRLTGDIDIYIDEIILSDSAEPRAASTFCTTGGSVSATRYMSSLQTLDGLVNAKIVYTEKPTKVLNAVGTTSVVAERGAAFTLKFAQKSTTNVNTAYVTDLYADFNCDREYVSNGEYLGRLTGEKQGDSILYTAVINVPSTATIGSGSIRIKFTDASDGAVANGSYASCDNVVDGLVYDLYMDIKDALERPTIKIEGISEQSGWGSIAFDGLTGTEVKVVAGSSVTCVATPSAGHEFVVWYNKETGSPVSTKASYSISVQCDITLVAKFAEIAYCKPTGVTLEYYAGKISITPQGASTLYYIGSATESVDEVSGNYVSKSILGGVNIRRGNTFTLNLTKAASSSSFTAANIAVWVDWNLDHEFTVDELVASEIGADGKSITGTVPTTATKGDTRIRVRIAEGSIAATDACNDVDNGVTYDLIATIAPNTSEIFLVTATPSIAGAATYSLNVATDADGKIAAGTDLEITCVPVGGYKFVEWKRNGVTYGATMSANNPLPLTGLSEDLELTMEMEPDFPTYCEGTAPNNSSGNHYGITSGSLYVNSELAFNFSNGGETIVDLSSTCIANVCPGDTLKLTITGGTHTQWGEGYLYIDWNMDGTWDESTEAILLYNAPLTQISNTTYTAIVPSTVSVGSCGVRLNTGEAYQYNSNTFGPCITFTKGTLYTFALNVTAQPYSNITTVKVTPNNENYGTATIQGSTKGTAYTAIGEDVTVVATPAADCTFVSWTKNGVVVSTDEVYTFTVTGDCELIANFTSAVLTYCVPNGGATGVTVGSQVTTTPTVGNYLIYSPNSNRGWYIYDDGSNNIKQGATLGSDGTGKDARWTLETATGGFYIKNIATGRYIQKATAVSQSTYFTMGTVTNAEVFSITTGGTKVGTSFMLKSTTKSAYLNSQASGVCCWSGTGEWSQWQFFNYSEGGEFINTVTIDNGTTNFTVNTTASINDLQTANVIDAYLGENITITMSSDAENTADANIVIYADWNIDGTFSTTSNEQYFVFGTSGATASGAQFNNVVYTLTVPESATLGITALRIISEESTQYTATNSFAPCDDRTKGSIHTFGLRIHDTTVGTPTVGVEKTNLMIDAYPNPVVDRLYITATPNAEIRLMTINGIVVVNTMASETLTSVDVRKLPAGIYLLQVVTDGDVKTQTISKK